MSGPLTLGASLTYRGGSSNVQGGPYTIQVAVAGTQTVKVVQTIGTTEEALIVGDVGAGGYVLLKNLDSTNYIEVFDTGEGPAGNDTGIVKLLAGDIALFRATRALYAVADTAACDLEITAIDL